MAKSAKAKPRAKAKPAGRKAGGKKAAESMEHVRILAAPRLVKSIIDQVLAAKNRTSAVGQDLSTVIRNGQEAGVNIPALRIAARVYSTAKQDPAKARVLFEDVIYYLEECTDFAKLAPQGMFTAKEAGQGAPKKRPKKEQQMMMPIAEDDRPEEMPATPSSQAMPGEVGPMLQ